MNNQNPNNNRNYNSQNNNPNYNNDQYNNYPNDQYNQYNEQYNNPDYNGQYNNPGYTGQQYDNQNTQYNNTVNDQQYYNQQNNQQYNVPPVNPNYNNYNDNNSYNEEPKNEKKKSPIPIIITAVVTFLVLVVGLYFGYNKFMKKENVVDVSAYEINFVTYGTNGEGKPEVDIKKIPEVANTSTEISNFLSKPDISYDKKENLKNGDKVEVTITLNHNTAQKLKLDTKGEFKRTFTVNGLKEKEKEKETIIVKDNSSSSSSSSNSNRTYFSNRPARIYVDAGVNLRSSSNDSSSVLDTAKKGDTVYVDFTERNSKGEEWSYVTYKGKQGWMRTDLIGH